MKHTEGILLPLFPLMLMKLQVKLEMHFIFWKDAMLSLIDNAAFDMGDRKNLSQYIAFYY